MVTEIVAQPEEGVRDLGDFGTSVHPSYLLRRSLYLTGKTAVLQPVIETQPVSTVAA